MVLLLLDSSWVAWHDVPEIDVPLPELAFCWPGCCFEYRIEAGALECRCLSLPVPFFPALGRRRNRRKTASRELANVWHVFTINSANAITNHFTMSAFLMGWSLTRLPFVGCWMLVGGWSLFVVCCFGRIFAVLVLLECVCHLVMHFKWCGVVSFREHSVKLTIYHMMLNTTERGFGKRNCPFFVISKSGWEARISKKQFHLINPLIVIWRPCDLSKASNGRYITKLPKKWLSHSITKLII